MSYRGASVGNGRWIGFIAGRTYLPNQLSPSLKSNTAIAHWQKFGSSTFTLRGFRANVPITS